MYPAAVEERNRRECRRSDEAVDLGGNGGDRDGVLPEEKEGEAPHRNEDRGAEEGGQEDDGRERQDELRRGRFGNERQEERGSERHEGRDAPAGPVRGLPREPDRHQEERGRHDRLGDPLGKAEGEDLPLLPVGPHEADTRPGQDGADRGCDGEGEDSGEAPGTTAAEQLGRGQGQMCPLAGREEAADEGGPERDELENGTRPGDVEPAERAPDRVDDGQGRRDGERRDEQPLFASLEEGASLHFFGAAGFFAR